MSYWIQTYTGKRFDLTCPAAADVDIRDIAHALSLVCRFGGHTTRFYSVAQHSVLTSWLVDPRYALHALLHDAHEAYIGDITRPMKHILTRASDGEFVAMEARIEHAICERFGTTWDAEAHEAVKRADDIALVTEARDCLSGGLPERARNYAAEPSLERLTPWLSHDRAELEFQMRFVGLVYGESPLATAKREWEKLLELMAVYPNGRPATGCGLPAGSHPPGAAGSDGMTTPVEPALSVQEIAASTPSEQSAGMCSSKYGLCE